jgi:hypothetical protein
VVTCTIGHGTGTDVVLAGDSHAVQWGLALARIADASDWHVTMLTKQFCPLARDVEISSTHERSCTRWQAAASARLLAHPPDVLITSQEDYRVVHDGTLLGAGDGFRVLAASQRRLYQDLIARGTKVVVIRNTPHAGIDIADCVTREAKDLTKCSILRSKALNPAVGETQRESVAGLRGARFVDLDEAICPTRLCAPVIGSVLVFQDANHMTSTYGESLAPRLAKQLPGAAPLP